MPIEIDGEYRDCNLRRCAAIMAASNNMIRYVRIDITPDRRMFFILTPGQLCRNLSGYYESRSLSVDAKTMSDKCLKLQNEARARRWQDRGALGDDGDDI